MVAKGDILGLCITLPKPKGPLEPVSVELLKRLWDPSRMEQYMPFQTNPLETMPETKIEYYLNGEPLGVAFTDLYQGSFLFNFRQILSCGLAL